MRASSPLVVLLMVALAALAKASVFGGRKRRGTPGGSAFCYTTPLNRGFFHRPYILRPSGLYKSNDDDASTFSVPDASPTPQSSSPSLSPSSSSSSSTAIFPYVRVEEAAHPLLHRSLPRSFAFFLQRARAIFFPSPCTPSSSPSSRLTPATSPPPAIWPRLREICRPEYPLLTLSTLTLLLAASVEVAVPHFSSQALSAILQQKGQTEFFRAVQRVFELGVLAALSTGVRGLCFGLAGTRIVCRLRHALFKSLLQQDIAFFDRTKSGELTNRLTADCVKISNVVSLNVNILLRQAIQLLGGLLYLHRLHARIALLTAGGMAVIFLVTGAHGRYNRKMAEEIQDTLASSNAVAGTSLSLIRLVRTHVGESTELERYDQALCKTLNNMEAHDFGYGAYRLAVRLAQTGLLTAVLTVGWQLTCSGAMSMDQLTSALFYVQFVMNASFDVSDQYSRIQEALGSATQVFALLDRTPAMSVKPLSPSPSLPTSAPSSRATSSPSSSSERHGASVVFSNVSFTYPLRPHTPILSSLYLNIGPGQRVAVVGASGGGKSTLLRLLARHYDVDAGSIFLGALGGREGRREGRR
ncbi:atp-binding cassette sub-family b member 9, partial [Nannochloropsis gaditana]